MIGLKVKIEEPPKMKEFIKVMIGFSEKPKIVEAFETFEKESMSSLNNDFIETVSKLFNSAFGSGFPRNNDEYYQYLYYYESKNKQNSDNRSLTQDGWSRFFQHHSFKNLQKHVKELFNNDMQKINQDLPQWFVCFLGMVKL